MKKLKINIDELTLREKVGQMIIMRLYGKEITKDTKEMIEKYKIGGVVLYRKNYDTYEEMIKLINELVTINKNSNNIPLFICIDQEGGRVNRMPYEIKNIKSARKIANTKKIEIVKEAGNITAKMLKESGFNMNFAPVLDIQRFENGHAIGDRCYGDNIEEVSLNGIKIMEELSKGGVIPVIKHFPGHGATTKDSHFLLPKINKTFQELEKEDLVPFEKAIEKNAEVIMIGHLMIKDMDNKNPASLSKKIIQDYLVKKYNYKGLIITDDLKMKAISFIYGYIKASVKAFKAGNHMIMIGAPYYIVKRSIRKIEKYIINHDMDMQEINERIEKIIKLKEKYNIEDKIAQGCDIETVNEKIEEINRKIEQA